MNLSDSSFTISCWIKQTTWTANTFGAIYGDWNTPRQFLLGTMNQRIVFYRHSNVGEEWWSLQSTNVSLSNWTHLAVTWNHLTGAGNPKTRSLNRPPNIVPQGLVLGNCPKIQNKAKQKLYSNTKFFAFAKELLRVPNDCSQNVSHYIAVCIVHS